MGMADALDVVPHSGSRPRKASVVDLGSNSIKMVNYNIASHNLYKSYRKESVGIKLAEGVVDGAIREDHMARTIDALKLFRNIVDLERIDYEIAVATSSVRDAENRDSFLQRIRKATGFDFRILSEREEALYSHAGAMRSLNLPSVVFFDIGGGSIEIVSSAGFQIRRVISLRLGALSLTRKFSSGSGFTEEAVRAMRRYVEDLLPTRVSLGLPDSDDIVLVGVGGTLRALARYDQQRTNYPFRKLHNYVLRRESLERISSELFRKDAKQIARIKAIGSGRSDTVAAGSFVICGLMRRLLFSSVVVSAQGLREGTLALAQQYPEMFSRHEIDERHVQELISSSCRPETLSGPAESLVCLLFSMGLVSEREKVLLAESLLHIDDLSSFRDVDNVLHTILDDDIRLSHREQLMVALSLIHSQKRKRARELFKAYDRILEPSDGNTIRKMSAVVSLCSIFYKTGARLTPGLNGSDSVDLDIRVSGPTFPEALLRRIATEIGEALGISITMSVHCDGQSAPDPSG